MVGKAAVFIMVSLVLVVGTAVAQGLRPAVFALLGCVSAGALLLLAMRSRSGRR
ncbi:hypothetical protein FHX81_1678 [Saccharothrix saharensis]|uniref:Uncharacterized protein n=1 Tax=Saccharothrix saharensis TaxID=571190 RepID=A0A543J971_9PSEU|nr:hypothetical protein FHX81_1678 [Saccharothrix saharensis]